MSKKILAFLAAMMMLTGCMAGCGGKKDKETNSISASTSKDETSAKDSEEEKETDEPTTEKESECSHKWEDADCETPKTCSECGKTEGKATGHKWDDATCQAPKTCSVCGETEGKASEHTWDDATCEYPMICSKCGETMGSATGHSWSDASCEAPQICSKCGKTQGRALGHVWMDATYDAPKTCSECGATEGSPLERPAISFTIINSLPQEFSYHYSTGTKRDTVKITNVAVSYEADVWNEVEYDVTLYFTGEKLYDMDGNGQSRSCSIGIKIYDEEGYVVDDTTFYSPDVCVGDKFRDAECYIWDIPAGNYTIELLNTN